MKLFLPGFLSVLLLSSSAPLRAQSTTPGASGYDVFLMAGQSNMVGYGSGVDSSSDAATNPRISQWDSATNQIILAADPLYSYQGKQFFTGMGITFAKAYLSGIPSNRQVLLVNAAIGGTSFADGTWIAGSGIGATTAVQYANAAMAAAGPGARLAGILWHQGESDVQENGAAAYQTNLQNLISYFRSSITGAGSSTPFVAGEFTPPWLVSQLSNTTYAPQQLAILEVIHSLPDYELYTAWTSSELLSSDLSTGIVHFSALSQRALGRRYAERFFLAVNGLPQPQMSLKSWAGAFYDDGRGLLSLATLPTNNPPSVTGTVSPIADPLRGNVAHIFQGQGSLSSSLPASAFNASYTKMAWFNPGAAGYSNFLISASNPGQTHFLQAQTLTNSTVSLAAGHASAANSANISATVSAAAGAWMHIALVYDAVAETMTLYLNGGAVATQSNIAPAPPSTTSSSTLPLVMGTLTGSGTSGLDGEMAGNRVWTSALTAAQIASIYNFEVNAIPTSLVFGSVASSSAATETYNFSPTSGVTVTGISILTEGNAGSEFSLAGTSTCAPAGATPCGVNVTFTPQFPGLRRGALLITDSTGTQTTVFLSGTGPTAPSYSAASPSVLASGLSNPLGVAVDGAANVYIANSASGTVSEVNASGSVVRTITGLNSPSGVAIDGAGNLYITESAAAAVVKVLPGAANFTLVASGFNTSNSPQGPSADGAGNVYVADTGNNSVVEISASGQAHSVSTGSLTLSAPAGTALDSAGNLYIADSANGRIVEVPTTGAANSKVYAGGFSNPTSVAIDAAGDLFVTDSAAGTLYEVAAGSTALTPLATGFSNPNSVTVAANGSVYVADTGNNRIVQFQRAVFSLQTLTFSPIPTQTAGNTLALAATASSGLAVSYASSTTSICTVSGSTVTLVTAGTCSITASQAGNSIYAPATPVSQSFTVQSGTTTGGTTTTVSLGSAATLYGIFNNGTNVTNGGLDTSDYAYSANLLGTGLTFQGIPYVFGMAGSANAATSTTIALPTGSYSALNFLGTAIYGSQTSQTFTVTYTDGTTSTFTQSMSDWGAPQNYTGETVASAMAYRVTPSGAQSTGQTFNLYAYSFALNSAKTVKSFTLPNLRNLTVLAVTLSGSTTQAAQTITFNAIPSQIVGGTLTVSATATSGLPVTFSVVPNGNCSISGLVVTFLNAGNCGVVANQAGNSSYAAAPAVGQIVFVNSPTTQTITFGTIAAQTVGTPLTLSATASSGLAVSFASTTGSVCTVSGTTSAFVAAGTCTITASQAGNNVYSPATSVSQSFTVNAAALKTQTITFGAIASQTVGTPLALSATASSGMPVTFASTTGSACTISGTTATFVAAGTCTITASQAGNSIYAAAPSVSQSFTVNAAALQSQTISFGTIASQTVGTPLNLTATATASSALAVSFASTTGSVCTISGTTATFVAAGTCTITASQAGNSTYAAAPSVSQSFTVNAAALKSQTITFNAIPAQTVGSTLTISATASSGLPVTFTVVPNGNCSVSGNVVTFLNYGNCGVIANQAGNSAYAAAPAVGQIIVVNPPTPQTITFGAIAAQTVGTPLTLTGTASSGLAVSYTSSTTSICTASGSNATFLAAGTCKITASQAGNSTYSAATSVSQSFTVNAAALKSQTITFNAIAAQKVGSSLTVSAGASSGLPVTFAIIPNGNCSIAGSVVTFLNTGNCGVVANQAGNSTYAAAPAVGQIIVVNN